MSGSPLWFLTRGTGVVALLLLTLGLVLGIAGTDRRSSIRRPRFLVHGLHRNVTLLALAFVAVHVVTTLADAYAPIRVVDTFVPFASSYRPVWLGLGAVALDLLLALILTSVVRARLGLRAWRVVHWLAYAAWPSALVHALGTGSDARTGWLALVAFGSVTVVALAVLWRAVGSRGTIAVRGAAGAAALVVPLVLFLWYDAGPAKHGWARRAGTPTSLFSVRRP
jgi:sulfoxide reductase heme-binding subunit YedZ